MKVYISGKISGLPIIEVTTKFGSVQKKIQDLGHTAINPLAVVNDFKSEWLPAMRKDIKALMDADLVFAMPCHIDSKGADIEINLCEQLGIPVIYDLKKLK